MIEFVLISTGLTLLCLFLIVPALVRPRRITQVDMDRENLAIAKDRLAEVTRDDEYDDASELEATLLSDLAGPDYAVKENPSRGRWGAMILLLLAPIAAGVIYSQIGDTRWLEPPETWSDSSAPPAAADIQELLAKLELNLQENPDNADGWAIAGRMYMVLNRFDMAEAAYAQVHALVGDDPDILTAWADASLMRNGGLYTPMISARIERALELDPVQINALWLGALGSLSKGDQESATQYLGRLRPLLANNPEALAQLESLLGTHSTIESSEHTNDGDSQESLSAQSEPARIRLEISMTPELQLGLNPDTPIFVFARAVEGSRMPLAAKRITVGDLPLAVFLDDNDAMIKGVTLSDHGRVIITARGSLSGSPLAQSGDLTSESIEVSTRGEPSVSLLIAHRIP